MNILKICGLNLLIVIIPLIYSPYSFAENLAPNSKSEKLIEEDKKGFNFSSLKALQTLYEELAKAPDEATAEKITISIEKIWAQSGSSTADLLLGRAITAANSKDFDGAMYFLNRTTELYPDWPEAYNRRAYLFVLRQDYVQALADLRRVLSLDAQNFRALEGLVQVLSALGQTKAAVDANRQLLNVHPLSPGAKENLLKLENEIKNQGI